MRIATTLQEKGAWSWKEGEAHWDRLSPTEQAEVAKLVKEVVGTAPVIYRSRSDGGGCNSVIASRSFTWAGGTIYGGKVFHTVRWCYHASGCGHTPSNSCTGGHDQVFPGACTGWARYCELPSGGNGPST